MAKIQMDGYRCERCMHEWAPRNTTDIPRVCPSCKSAYWNRPKKIRHEAIAPKTTKIEAIEQILPQTSKHTIPSNHEREIALFEYAAVIDNKNLQEREKQERLNQWHKKYKGWFKNEPIEHGQSGKA